MGRKLSLNEGLFKDKKVLIRVDFNVPLKNGQIIDDTRIKAHLPTIEKIIDQGGSVILLSHLGRPEGKKDPAFSLKPCQERLSQLTGKEVLFVSDCIGDEVKKVVKRLKPGEILLLENLRFYKEEEAADETFAKQLASLGDCFVNDAFATAHRAHASTALIASFFPGNAFMGSLMEKEIHYLSESLMDPKRPFCAILGGAKVSSKFKVIEKLIVKADSLLIGGAMAYTFFKALGIPIGDSLVEESYVSKVLTWMKDPLFSARLFLPLDSIIVQDIKPQSLFKVVSMIPQEGIPASWKGVDIGPQTITSFASKIAVANTIFWNGPMGVFEVPPFNKGTEAVAQCIVQQKASTITIAGGGETAAALSLCGLSDQFTHVSTGGGASIEYLEKESLPGIESLSDVGLPIASLSNVRPLL